MPKEISNIIGLRTPADMTAFLDLAAAAGERGTPCHHKDPEIWFNRKTEDEAVAACRTCPLKYACREFALDTKQTEGVWGAMTEAERADEQAARKRAKRQEWARLRAARAAATEPMLDDALFAAYAS